MRFSTVALSRLISFLNAYLGLLLSPLHSLLRQEDFDFQDVSDFVRHNDQEYPLQESRDASDDENGQSHVGFSTINNTSTR